MSVIAAKRVNADFAFLLDGSAGNFNFRYEKTFIKSIARRLKINWRKSRVAVAAYGRTAYSRMRGYHQSLERTIRAIDRIRNPRFTRSLLYEALKTSLGFFSNRCSRKILVVVVNAKKKWQSLRFRLNRLQFKLRSQGVKLFVAAVGLKKPRREGNIFLIPVRSFRRLVTKAAVIASMISKKMVCYLISEGRHAM